ncbi:hypothetical protein OG885_41835 [Streptomyces sp. NBC_00028]|uniref:hypothetical protein n=1 Tax=Streptomyces sp. NBC_00028 TaxID=2975624 RepID=UPI003248C249
MRRLRVGDHGTGPGDPLGGQQRDERGDEGGGAVGLPPSTRWAVPSVSRISTLRACAARTSWIAESGMST